MSILFFLTVVTVSTTFGQTTPPADYCQLVNASEPNECPDHIGPPCPPCIVNQQSDYVNGDSLNISSATHNKIIDYMNRNIDYWIKNYPPSRIYPSSDPSDIYQGAAGRGQIFLRLYINTKNDTYLTLASQYFQNALKNMNNNNKQTSFLMGNVGIYTMTALYYNIIADNNNFNKYLSNVLDIFNDINTAIINNDTISPKYRYSMSNVGLFTGITGLLYNGIFLNEYFKSSSIIINATILTNIVHHLLDVGIETGAKQGHNYMMFDDGFLAGCYLVGAGEGIGGVLRMILEAYHNGYVLDILDDNKYEAAITNTLHFLVSLQYPDGNMPTYLSDVCARSYGNDNDARVQWCHGAPSFQDTFSKAALVYSSVNVSLSEKWLDAGLKAFEATWNRGLLIKGLMQCHGIGGNIYTMLNLFDNLQELQQMNNRILNGKYDFNYLINESGFRAKQMIIWTLNDTNLDATRTRYSNADFSMFWSSYSIPVLYVEVIQDGWPFIQTCMPAWNYCI